MKQTRDFIRTIAGAVLVALVGACANHPVDCAIGFHHDDCLPGTAGYDDPNKFAKADDEQCKSYGLVFGTPAYADCRVKLDAARKHGVFN